MFYEFGVHPDLPADKLKGDMQIEEAKIAAEKSIVKKVQHPLQPTEGSNINDGGWEWA